MLLRGGDRGISLSWYLNWTVEGRRGAEMTANHRKDALEVAHITGVQGIRAAMARLADEEADVPLPGAVTEEVPLGRRTCAVCAADNDGSRETCWNCGASLRRVR